MKITYNWLKDFVEIKISPKALAGKLTMAGLEVISLEEQGGDFVFEIEVTSNRPDWLSVIGIAREVAAITGKQLKKSQGHQVTRSQVAKKETRPFKIEIEDKKDCPLYTAKIIKGVKVGPSPEWLKTRLELIGCRSVNNIVDITNYILFTFGEPLHAFDLDKLNGNAIEVRRAKAGEKITTIDGEARPLGPDILVIADEVTPVAVAGVMGSRDTEVSETTKNILLEAAAFNPIVVRRGRRDLGVQSDSSYRFERGVNLEIVDKASLSAVELIQELAAGSCLLAKSTGTSRKLKKTILFDAPSVNEILGIDIPASKAKKILNDLGFKVKTKTKERFVVEIPAHRPDITSEIDLTEEIARIYGYEDLPQTLPSVKPAVSATGAREAVSLIKNILAGLGSNEVITYTLTSRDFLIAQSPELIEVLNPLSREQEVLRRALMPSLAACVACNLNQKQEYINIFEAAKVFSQSKGSYAEELRLGIALCGTKSLLLEQGLIKESVGLLHLKGILEALFARLGIKDYSFNSDDNNSSIGIYIAQERLGLMGALEKPLLDKLDIKNKGVFGLELSLERLLPYINLNKEFIPLPIYPGISRDISLILKDEVKVNELLAVVKEMGRPLLKEARVADYYKGKQIPAGFKGLTISSLYRSDERTLTEAEINPAHSLICNALSERFGAKIR